MNLPRMKSTNHRKAKLHELILPTKYQLWHKYVWNTKLDRIIGVDQFADLLNKRQAIEFVDQKGFILCKTLNESKIQDFLAEVCLEPYKLWWQWQLLRLARILKG